MTFKPYPKYTASGVEWLGHVPDGWEAKALKHCVEIPITDGPHETPEFVDSGMQFISAEAIKNSRIDFEKRRGFITTQLFFEYSKKCIPRRDDIFMVKSGNTTGAFAIVETDSAFAIWSPLALIRVDPRRFLPKFVYYNFAADFFQENVRISCSYGTQPNIGMGVIEGLVVSAPPLIDQQSITTFLDRETTKIDALIAKQEAMVSLLKEKRKAAISHVVTKGLIASVPMKPSGVEWLGDVPEHWITIPMKHIMTMTSGGTPTKDRPEYWNGTHPWASAKDLKVEVLDDTQDHISDLAVSEGGATVIAPNAVLIVVRGMILLHTLPVTVNAVPMAINQDLKALRSNSNCDPGYLAVLLRGLSKEILGRTDQAAHGTKALREDDWTGMHVPLPPMTEQIAIARYISLTSLKTDTLIAKAQQAIALQKEHRIALISAAVTGKIDVRNQVNVKKAA